MTRRDWALAVAVTLSVGALPGCLHVPRSPAEGSRASGQPASAAESDPAAEVPPPAETGAGHQSSYAIVPTPPVAPTAVADTSAIPEAPSPPTPPAEAVPGDRAPQIEKPSAEPAERHALVPGWDGLAAPLEMAREPTVQIYPPPDTDPPVVAALRCLMEKRPDDAVSRLQGLDKANQDVLLCLLPLAARLGQGPLDRTSAADLTAMADQAETVAAPLRLRAPLAIDKMCFCRRIDKFGQYESLPDRHEFRCGELVQLYAELRNFSCNSGKAGYETRLASSVRLTCQMPDSRTETVWRQDFHDRDRVDRSRSPRRDYFNNYRFCIPENLPRGSYKLWLKVVDVPTGRSAESSLPLVVTDHAGP